jgi:mono/diheme cytochrome c family protein
MRPLILLVVAGALVGLACKRDKAVNPQPPVEEPAAVPVAPVVTPADDPPTTPAPAAPTAELLVRGVAAFEKGMCSKCHEADGSGSARAPNLTDKDWLHCDGSVEGIHKVLLNGVPKDQLKDPNRPFAMNPVTNLVPEEVDLKALAAYVESLSKGS